MPLHREMIKLQAEEHELVDRDKVTSKEKYVLHLMHIFAYIQASRQAKNRYILDLGCNTGYGSEILSQSAQRVVGVDVSKKAIAIANRKYGQLGILFRQIDGIKLPFSDNEFDMIVCFQVIEHIVDYDMYLGELKRVLAPMGIIFFTTPNARVRLDPGMKPWNKFHVREFDVTELESLLSRFFTAVKIYGLFAREPIYSIEINRLNRIRASQRMKNRPSVLTYIKVWLYKAAKMIIPGFLVDKIRRARGLPPVMTAELDESFIREHGTDDFFYRDEDLQGALDLLAICSGDRNSLQEIKQQFSPG